MDQSIHFMDLIIFIIITLIVFAFLLRWSLSINQRIKKQQTIINLLTFLAKKQGATDDELVSMRK